MSWKVVGDIHEIANAPPSSVEAEKADSLGVRDG